MGVITGLIFGCGMALAIFSLKPKSKQNKRLLVPEKYWPQFCDDISSAVRAGLPTSEATWQASASLPLFVQNQFLKHKESAEMGVSFNQSILNLSDQLESSTFSRIAFLIITANNQNSESLATILNEYASNLRTDLDLVNEIVGKQAVTRVSARVAALAPLVVLVMTSTRDSVRESFLTPLGLSVVFGSFIVTAFSYLLMVKISQIKALNA